MPLCSAPLCCVLYCETKKKKKKKWNRWNNQVTFGGTQILKFHLSTRRQDDDTEMVSCQLCLSGLSSHMWQEIRIKKEGFSFAPFLLQWFHTGDSKSCCKWMKLFYSLLEADENILIAVWSVESNTSCFLHDILHTCIYCFHFRRGDGVHVALISAQNQTADARTSVWCVLWISSLLIGGVPRRISSSSPASSLFESFPFSLLVFSLQLTSPPQFLLEQAYRNEMMVATGAQMKRIKWRMG